MSAVLRGGTIAEGFRMSQRDEGWRCGAYRIAGLQKCELMKYMRRGSRVYAGLSSITPSRGLAVLRFKVQDRSYRHAQK